ncbi:Hypothetical predicted protein [Paramuricea clavata]|uniref:Uncharacterized protein n=1 Tax=Paramuricea clavata TaxID=317549 RepID=A0A7D9DJV9_PARCT|nr:Hypothetical predicted protein [Paramuricea clavata]
MFRHTITFLLIFLVANHDFAAARSVEFVPEKPIERLQKRDVVGKHLEVSETGIVEAHSRTKRFSGGSAFRLGLSISSGTAFALSTGTTLYHAIRKCKDYRPHDCKSPNCQYLSCPSTCKGPDTNREYVEDERKAVKAKLTVMDNTQRDAFNLATKAINAGLNNQRIFTEIDRINQKVDELVFSIAQLDIKFATLLRNSSVAIGTLLRDKRLSLNDIVSSPEIEGLFDKWTWEGTGVFVLSIALPLSLYAFNYLRQRHAVNQIYKSLKTDFSARFVNQKTSGLNPNAKINNKFAYVQGVTTKTIDKQLKGTAKAIHASNQASQKVTKVEKFVNTYITPAINVIVTILSVWATYQQINNCQLIANDMQETAIDMAEEADEIEKIKQLQVDPLLRNVTTQAWPNVRGMMTNETTLDWLDGIRNLSLGASNSNGSIANVIQDFIDKIASANYDKFIALQTELITALKSVDYEYTCLANKQKAITTVITDCRIGRLPFPELYDYATNKHSLNVPACISKGIFPYTTEAQFFTILNATAAHQGWYSKCLLNNNDLLYRVCAEKIKGYNTPAEIVNQVNRTGLTEDMIPNFLARCPPPKITPKSIIDTCELYCLYQPVSKIAKTVVLLESQVEYIMKTCPICSVTETKLKQICNFYSCEGQNASTIEKTVEKPLPTVEFIIANNCSGCAIDDPALKKTICVRSQCRGHSAAKIANDVGYSESAVDGVFLECTTIVPSCLDAITGDDRKKVFDLDCYSVPVTSLPFLTDLTLQVVKEVLEVIKGQTCPPPLQFKQSNG